MTLLGGGGRASKKDRLTSCLSRMKKREKVKREKEEKRKRNGGKEGART